MNKWKHLLVSRRCCTRCFPRCLFSRSHLSCSSFKQVSNPIRVDVHLEVLVHQLNGFFVSLTRQNTIDSRQQCSCCQRSCPGSTLLRYHVCRVSALHCCAELCSAHPTAFPLIGPQCTVRVLAGTKWGAHGYPSRTVPRTKRQPSGCCSAAATAETAITAACVRVRSTLDMLSQTESLFTRSLCFCIKIYCAGTSVEGLGVIINKFAGSNKWVRLSCQDGSPFSCLTSTVIITQI